MVGKKLLSASAALAMLASAGLSVTAEDKAVFTVTEARADSAALKAQQSAVLTFTDAGITETEAGSGYTVNGTVLTVTAAGTYRICGSCTEGSIIVAKGLTGVTLILDGLSLASSGTAPIVIRKQAAVNIHLEGTSTLTDNEDPAAEVSTDTAVADAFEGAAIKVKSGAAVTFCGDGDLNISANAKNGIKGASEAALTFSQSGTVNISGSGRYYGGTKSGAAVNSGIACDGSIVFNSGSYVIKAAGDGIKSDPETDDADSAGTVTVNGGSFDIDADGDGIQADSAVTVNGGSLDIFTWKGHTVWNDTLANACSCKGLKAGGDRAEASEAEPQINITGGSFVLDTGDDALHSDAFVTVTGGSFVIDTGDDGMHAGTSLIIGTEGGYERDPDITVNSSYEGLEGGTVYIYSGRCYAAASDDGVNAAGGSSSGSDPGAGAGGGFNPGGGRPGGRGGQGSFAPDSGTSAGGDYNIYIYGGNLYVNCDGDGLDSNGGLYLYGGRQAVFSMKAGGDNSALDSDGSTVIQDAAVFTAGTQGVDGTVSSSWFGSGQKYAVSSVSRTAGTAVSARTGSSGDTVFSYTLPKNVNYILASWPSEVSASAPAFSAGSLVSCRGGSQSHSWDGGRVTTAATASSAGVMTYTCTECGETEHQTIPMLSSSAECDHSVDAAQAEGYSVSFAGDAGVKSVTVYMTQDYTGESETVSAGGSTVSRDSDSGEPDSSGSGQVNFTVVPAEGYVIESVTATEGAYKNIKGPSDTGLENTYRITKITSDLTVTVTTSYTGGESGFLLGDVNSDGRVSMLDITTLQRYVNGWDVTIDPKAADLNGDGEIGMKDITSLQRLINGYTL